MKAPLRIAAVVVLFVLAAVGSAAGMDMQEGMWEITTEFEMTGMPMKMPPMTHTQCIRKSDMVPKAQDQQGSDQQCSVSNVKTAGNTVSYDMECTGPQNRMKGHGEATYTGSTMSGFMKMQMLSPQAMEMNYKYSGRRVGPCQ
ncbi:MAG: DUF3617 domain-containing protein [Desulfobacteraceae bacterium]|jgi:hypothetical protein|nr:DUF3617 domain-containing protein [Desulfobacteraceae bacterium]